LCHGMAESRVVSRAMIRHRPQENGRMGGRKKEETPKKGGFNVVELGCLE
jgi:hypothetical protein